MHSSRKKCILRHLNFIRMVVLKYLTPKEMRAELEVFGIINYAVYLYLYFYNFLFYIVDITTRKIKI